MTEMVLGGRYQVKDRIGTGGMATVYRGQDTVLGRTVAIKTMLPQYATDASFAARFKQEAQAAAALQSPYIVSVYDWGKDKDTYYLVMEYLRGTDLKSGIRKHGALDCRKVAQIASQIAQALSVAHRHDIIHRDIKPQNIMVQTDGNVKVMDFGIARAKNSHLTTDNSVLGTAHYVSPEQTQGKPLGPTSDIYSLGVVMYEAVTGRVPFQGDDAISVALKQVNEQPMPPSQRNPSVDASLEAIILKCMQKDPTARFQSAEELGQVLRDYLAGRTQAINAATAVLPIQAANKMDRGLGATAATPPISPALSRLGTTQSHRPVRATDQVAEEEERRLRAHRRNIIVGALIGFAVVCIAAYALISSLTSQAQSATVPNLINLTQEQALESIEQSGFATGEVRESYSDTIEEGRVAEQDPAANRQMPRGTKITIFVSRGPQPKADVTVPDLSNLTASQVSEQLSSNNLLGRAGEEEYSTTIEAGHVIRQDPVAGSSVKAGDTVTYYLSKGPEQVTVPNVVGDTEQEALTTLTDKDLDLKVNVQNDYSATVEKGYVISTSPAANTEVDKGSSITIVVSSGAEPKKPITVPDVVGQSYASAKRTLENLGFVVSLRSGSERGTVTSQSVTGSAVEGTTIQLTCETTGSSGTDGSAGNNNGDTSGGSSSEGD